MLYPQNRQGFEVDIDPARLDVEAIHAFLTTSYWSAGISKETVTRALSGSLAFGLYAQGRQAGLARVVTDRATFAYLCDVYVLPEIRGRGLGRWLMECVMDHPDLQGIRRFSLVTRDAHELYRPLGFRELAAPDRHMEIVRPDLYRQDGQALSLPDDATAI
jgi:GNAT superfamily N-acetyltransferase